MRSLNKLRHLLFLVLSLVLLVAPLQAAPLVRAVDSIGITVSDMDRSLAFYTGVLTFKKESDTEISGTVLEQLTGVFGSHLRVVRLALGEERIDLLEYITPQGRPIPVDSHSNDRWFQHIAIIVSDMDQAYALLRRHHVRQTSPNPQVLPAWNPNAGGIAAFYFHDPDGNNLEILHFPPGKGNPKWQTKTGQIFLGIDHTAIVVADTEASLRLYRDALGMQVAGTSDNYGIEQERLNNVFGAHLRITALRSASGPGIELLEYLTPRTGRPMPPDTQADDLWHWQTQLVVDNPAIAGTAIRQGGGHWVSPNVAEMNGLGTGFNKELLSRDADGHGLLLMGR